MHSASSAPRSPAVEIGVHQAFISFWRSERRWARYRRFEDHTLNDYRAKAIERLESNRAFSPKTLSIRIEQADSLSDADQLLEWLEGRAPRFSVSTEGILRHAENDIRLATSVCCEEA